jgi:DNA-directed RNA polymerase subunit RPC12/RpoP
MCNKCDNKYVRSNTVVQRKKGGRCPECTSSDTKLVMSTPTFKTCSGGAHGGKVV